MRISCPECSETYNVKESMIPLEGVKTRCKSCDIIFQINPREVVDIDSLTGAEGQSLPAAAPIEVEAAPEAQAVVESEPSPEPELEPAPQPTVAPKPEPDPKPPTEVPVYEDDESIIDRIKTQFKDLEVEQMALITAPVLILVLIVSLIQMEQPTMYIAPPPFHSEEVDDMEEADELEEYSEGMMGVVSETALEEMAESAEEELAVEIENSEAAVSTEAILEEEGEAAIQEQEQVEIAEPIAEVSAAEELVTEESVAAVPVEESHEATSQEISSDNSSAAPATAGIGLYSVERFTSLMEQLETGAAADELASEVVIEMNSTAPAPMVEVPTAEAPTIPVVVVEQTENPGADLTSEPMQRPAYTTENSNVGGPADHTLYSVNRFTQLMKQLDEGGDIESMAGSTSEISTNTAPEIAAPVSTPAETVVTAPQAIPQPMAEQVVTTTSDSLYSIKRFTTLMKQLEGGNIPEESTAVIAAPQQPQATAEPAPEEVKAPVKTVEAKSTSEEAATMSAIELEPHTKTIAPTDSSSLYSVDRFKSLMDRLSRGEEVQ